ncbi:hypothetical protein GJ700_17690 [Duganella sp. FT92W]|uniref:Uncharacterized protein n=1 Tax=Pseudoduganella rivuli TaxID=2666085 RepID=A0A7X2LU38_9BURK|nr:hypothetical protein [Pseudoduganella rivuli]MRV73548.1 hypothetical protein [Pseudoduganella rivuli]
MNLKIERYYPHVIALGCGFIWYRLGLKLPADEKEFLAAALSLGAVFTGFIATAQAILMALPSDSVMAQMRTAGYIPDLVRYISSALTGGILFCMSGLIGFFLLSESALVKLYFSTIWLVIAVFSVLTFHRVTHILLRIMRRG